MMTGLLYKDFVAIRGKRIAAVLVFVTLLILLFSVICRSDEVILVVGAMVIWTSLMLPLAVPLYVENAIFAVDEGKKKKAYLLSLPVDKRQQVASKYLFVGISYYVILSVTLLWGIFISSAMEQVLEDTALTDMLGLIPTYIHMCLILSALEMPFFAALGVKAGNALKQGILLILVFGAAAYLLFGDLHLLEKCDLTSLTAYIQGHVEVVLALQTFLPMAAVLCYYLSYRLAGALYAGKEPQDE